ncbi:cardiolipin synthase [Bacillus haikouensis]|jgi:cardiolipin synthase A/B|uniref:cardiolipin synthase n=1 Tax=Bacillus haikouensis TaxID=1510468 RepID=UPI0015551FBF|nr:cardiolipin synthase [Bacillus haikouensis]NQD65275.1 cardiolipin synthase [Bacillus haikouensis]
MKNTVKVLLFIAAIALSYFYFLDQYLEGMLKYVSLVFTFSVVIIGFLIFIENRHPTQTLTWLVVLGAFPFLGFIFYLLFGRNYRKEKMYKKKYILDKETYSKFEPGPKDMNPEMFGLYQEKHVQLAQRIGNSAISFSSETKVLTNGEETFGEILRWLKTAKHHIHMEYYIVRHDDIGKQIKDILIERAKDGVKVRFLYDAVGAWQLSNAYINELKGAGIEVMPFGPVKIPFLNNKFNFRNHRKIIVIDGNIGFVGGLNIGDEYLGKNPSFGFWRDTHLFVKGEAVRTLQLIFLQDWYYMTNDDFLTPGYLSPDPVSEIKDGGVQMIAGGPDNELSVLKNIFFSMITSAQESVWVASPYFIPDEDIFSALKIAALSGIDVRLLVPHKPDKRIVFHASRSYFPELLEAGVRIYEYQKGFMHSKIVIVDNELASIGTSNMDMRSFHLNFEVNAFLYKTNSTQSLVEEYLNDLEHSVELAHGEFKKRHMGYRILESTSRLMSPLL